MAHAHAAIPHLAQVLAFDHFHGDVELASTWPASKVLTSPECVSRSTTLASSRKRLALPSSDFLGNDLLDHAQLVETVDLPQRRDVDLAHSALGQGFEQDILAELSWVADSHRREVASLPVPPSRR